MHNTFHYNHETKSNRARISCCDHCPRRYGETSLMRKVFSDNNYAFISVDFMTFTSREEAEKLILAQLSKLVIEIGGTEEKIKALAKKFYHSYTQK